ncbi:uveal autoantigen with coiled-coil domains and ankyrin repeats-like [Colossoma macropomum]|uniref:uveal autoantigen with coiled-coil domains and ankyrin repeats-like n=1 Tax=Colossoma macropomum TaxID=42526 RepID=UPI00186401AD|nr:uveal autoantigen with coiled-coil domains and ankyrin repeats-like [Colossoma macropomum]
MLKLSEKTDSKTDTKILLDAISKDKIHLARFILDALDGKIVDSKTEGAHTPLISSVFLPDSHARSKFMNLLLQRGANVNQQDESGRTALSYACEKGYLDAVKMLVRNNADPEMADAWGNTALMYAAVAGHSLVVEFLVRAFKRLGLQIDRPNKVGNSAVEVAKYLGHTKCLSALMCSSRKIYERSNTLSERLENTSEDSEESKETSERRDAGQVTLRSKSLVKDSTQLPLGLGPKRSLILQGRMKSMDSIEELEREIDSLPPSPRGFLFSRVLTPKPPQRSRVVLLPKQGMDTCTSEHLPPLSRGAEHHPSLLHSPRVAKDMSRSLAPQIPPDGPLSGPLGILLTPIGKANKEEHDGDGSKNPPCDFSMRRFDDSYYQKRCSLPTSALGPARLEHAPKPLLLRRFTFPELKRSGKEAVRGVGGSQDPHGHRQCGTGVRGMPRSETFPLEQKHPQVGSKPSVDSISAVKCEFDFQPKVA